MSTTRTLTAEDMEAMRRRGEEVIAANSNFGHAGRPGQIGGSAPSFRGIQEWERSKEANRLSRKAIENKMLAAHKEAAEAHARAQFQHSQLADFYRSNHADDLAEFHFKQAALHGEASSKHLTISTKK